MVRICVTGGRDFNDPALVKLALSQYIGQDVVLAHGNAPGADTLCAEFACSVGWPVKPYKADWKTYKKAAGGIRNSLMLQDFKPDVLVVFPGGSGTADCCKKAIDKGIRVVYASLLKET
jgi:YspA, cpYpsA-related SLOG family